MCEVKKYKGTSNTQIDKCMRKLIDGINCIIDSENTIIACCCGHDKYSMSIVIHDEIHDTNWELLSKVTIPRTRNFYKRDKEGYYYIPEVVLNDKSNMP